MKKLKKYLFPFLILTMVIQLAVPVSRIWDKFNVLVTGEEVKIRVNPIDPYDAFRGRYVSLGYNLTGVNKRDGKYGILKFGDDGFATVVDTTEEKPDGGLFLTSKDSYYFKMPIDRYYMEEEMFPVVMLDKTTKFYCPDCLVDKVSWCEVCNSAFEKYSPEAPDSGICPLCKDLKEKKNDRSNS